MCENPSEYKGFMDFINIICPTGPRSAVCSGLDCRSRGGELVFGPVPYIMESDHEIIPTVVLLLPLIQEGLLSVSSQIMCTKYWLAD